MNLRTKYLEDLPELLTLEGDKGFKIYTNKGTLISEGYNRIVIGDYGAFLEFGRSMLVIENIRVKEGQEYRMKDPKYKNIVKFVWLTSKDDSDIKIYYQRRPVSYADYRLGMFYVSPYEVRI